MENKVSELPEGYNSATNKPKKNHTVRCFMDNGTITTGYFYDNYYRSGWITMTPSGLMANQIWGDVRVIGWQELENENN